MKVEDILRLLFPLVAMAVASLFQILTQIRARIEWKRQAYAEVGDLGAWYRGLIVVPLYVGLVSLVAVFLASLFFVGVGAALTAGMNVPPPLPCLLALSPFLVVPYGILALLVFLDVIPEVLLAISRRFDGIRFKVGWVNARWQLRRYRGFFAMNLDNERTERLAHQIFADIRAKQRVSLPYQAPTPEGVDRDELANYLLAGCAIENRLKQLPHPSRPRLDTVWQALAVVACEASRPFAPATLARVRTAKRSVYSSLRESGQGTQLPESPLIEDSLNLIFRRLADDFDSRAARLATGRVFHKNGSPALLLRRLRRFDQYRASESIRRLFLKLSIRMGVWPEMVPGPFLYPFNLWIGSLLLNTHSLVVPADTKTIEPSDELAAIVAEGEDHVVASVHQMLLTSADEPESKAFAERVFGVPPREIGRGILSDYVDLWMFGHTKDFCGRRVGDSSGASLGCTLKVDDHACYCDLGSARWKPAEGKLVLDKSA